MTNKAPPCPIAPAFAALRDPAFLDSLTEAERLVLPYLSAFWLRPEQRIPSHDWSYHGTICGRGWGKTFGAGFEINDRVAAGLLRPGEPASIALMAPTDDRVDEVQIATLIATAPPWCKPERYRDKLAWPNGVMAELFTSQEPGRSRGGNFQLTWLTELVDWKPATRKEAFNNITTATRVNTRHKPAQMIWDTTSQGFNENIARLMAMHAKNPYRYPIQRGSMFDNYALLAAEYLATEASKYSGQRLNEEIRGKVYDKVEGAKWQQGWIDRSRLYAPAQRYEQRIVSIDPAISVGEEADETGMVEAGLRDGTEIDILSDDSGKYTPEDWGDLAVAKCVAGAAGCVIERNRGGDPLVSVVRARALLKQLKVTEIPDDDKPFPHRTPGVIYVRQVVARDSKSTRATSPAAYTEQGHVHLIGVMPLLESQLTTFVPDSGQRSPNRYDAFVYAVLELSGLERNSKGQPAAIAAPDVAAAYAKLREQLRGLAHGRRIGL